jgi:phage baseplate assembly protein W
MEPTNDLRLSAAGEPLDVTATGDLSLVGGDEGAVYALERRLVTRLGALLHRPAYGASLVDAVEAFDSPSRRAALAAAARRACLLDPRVAEARVRTAGTDGRIELNVTARLHQSPVEINARAVIQEAR